MAQVKSAAHTIAEVTDSGAKRRQAIAARAAMRSTKPAEKPAPTVESLKASAEALTASAPDLFTAHKRTKIIEARKDEAELIRRLAELRAARKQIEAQIEPIAKLESEIANVLKKTMADNDIARLTSEHGSYCYEPRSGGVRVVMPSEAYTLRS